MKIRPREGRRSPEGQQAVVPAAACTAAFAPPAPPIRNGHELDGPRGASGLKAYLEGRGEITTRHPDRCLTCRNCNHLPSGGATICWRPPTARGRRVPPCRRVWPAGLRTPIPRRKLLWPLYRLGQRLRPLMPARFRESLAAPPALSPEARGRRSSAPRRVLLLPAAEGLPFPTPSTRRPGREGPRARGNPRPPGALRRPQTAPAPGGAGAAEYRRLRPELESGAEALVMTASGGGSMKAWCPAGG